MLTERLESWYDKVGRKILIGIAIIVGVYIFFRLRILGLVAPFIVAWIFSCILNPFVTWAHRNIKLNRGVGTIISMLTILSALVGLVFVIVKQLWLQILGLAHDLPSYSNSFVEGFNLFEEKLSALFKLVPATEALSNIDTVIAQFMKSLSSLITSIIPNVYEAVAAVPDVVIFIVITLLSTFFMTKDHYYIKGFVKAQLSDTIIDKVVVMQEGLLQAVGGYIKTQCILMSITFTICLTGLFILGQPYALLLALIIAIIDALPVFGSGAILLPWAFYNIIVGNYSLGLGLIIIYGVIFVMRQVMEPRILANQIGVYALVTIMAVYIGYKIIGVLGLIIGPALVVILQMLQNVGALPQFKPVKKIDHRGE
nr:sporulation integral membrane protein YtvI [uncultured Cellulosilyticum sp.]